MKTIVKADPNRPRGKNYFQNMAEALSQLLGSLLGLNCNLTFSAYCGFWQQEEIFILRNLHKVVNLVMSTPRIIANIFITLDERKPTKPWVDKRHCAEAWRKFI